jgi:hypothetical protein
MISKQRLRTSSIVPIARRIEEHRSDAWDEQIEEDARTGRLASGLGSERLPSKERAVLVWFWIGSHDYERLINGQG